MIGRPFRRLLIPGNIHAVAEAPGLLAELKGARNVVGDKGLGLRRAAHADPPTGRAVIPEKGNRKRKILLGKGRHRSHDLIENAFYRLKDF